MNFNINNTLVDMLSIIPFNSEILAKIIIDSPLTPLIYKIAGFIRNSDEQGVVNDLKGHY